jgi:VanZ family protein
MPSLFDAASIFRKRFFPLVNLDPWSGVALIFGVQMLGALVVIHLFGLSLVDVAPAMILLLFGVLAAMIFRSRRSSSGSGSWKWWVLVCIYGLFIFSLSSRSYPEARAAFSTRLFHPIEYTTLGIFLSCAWQRLLKLKGTRFFLFTVQMTGILLAMSDELHQAFIPGRTPRVSDVCIDSFSVALGCGIFWIAIHTRSSDAPTSSGQSVS